MVSTRHFECLSLGSNPSIPFFRHSIDPSNGLRYNMNMNGDGNIPLNVIKKIPAGSYCYATNDYDGKVVCPYWASHESKPKQENGYCVMIGHGDWETEGTSLLWDHVKECGINMERRRTRKSVCISCSGTGYSMLNKCAVCKGIGKA